ncbi:Long-chain-fatty-acid CoA ligase [Entamoeba marina]
MQYLYDYINWLFTGSDLKMNNHLKLRTSCVGCYECAKEILPPNYYFVCGKCPDGLHCVCSNCISKVKNNPDHIFYEELLPYCCSTKNALSEKSFPEILRHLFHTFEERKCLGYRYYQGIVTPYYNWLTYKEVLLKSYQICSLIRSKHVELLEPILICGDVSIETYLVLIALMIGGYLAVPVHYNSSPEYITSVLQRCTCKLVFISKNLYDKLQNVLKNTTIIFIDDCQDAYPHQSSSSNSKHIIIKNSLNVLLNNQPAPVPPIPLLTNKTPLVLLSTSGSTGEPKLVIQTHQMLCQSLAETKGNIQIITLAFTLIRQLQDLLSKGASIALYSGGMDRLREDILLVRPTFFAATPVFWNSLYAEFTEFVKMNDISDLNLAYEQFKSKQVLGNRCHQVLMTGAQSKKEVINFLFGIGMVVTDGYGTSETGSLVNLTANSIQKLQYFVSDTPSRGEVVATSTRLTTGYYGDEELTNESFVTIDNVRYFRTGDIGEMVNGSTLKFLNLLFSPNSDSTALAVVLVLTAISPNDAVSFIRSLSGFKPHEIPQKFIIAKEPFSRSNGLLTATGKLSRPSLLRHYSPFLHKNDFIIFEDNSSFGDEKIICPTNNFISKQLEEILRNCVPSITNITSIDSIAELQIVDVGIDSIIVSRLSTQLNKVYAIQTTSRLLYNIPSFAQLQQYLDGQPIIFLQRNWSQEICNALPQENCVIDSKKSNKVLITGASGFIGKFVVCEFINKPIICIGRSTNNVVINTLTNVLKKTNRLNETTQNWLNSIEIYETDITAPQFGLTNKQYQSLLNDVQTVIHCSGRTHMLESYEALYDVNVHSVSNIIKFCQQSNANLIHISSLSCLTKTKINTEIAELPIEQLNELNGYAQTKVVADQIVVKAQGFKRCVVRVGSVGPCRKSSIFNPVDKYSTLLQKIIKHNSICYDESLPQTIPWIPVDYVSYALKSLVDNMTIFEQLTIYNVACEQQNSLKDFFGNSLKCVSPIEMTDVVSDFKVDPIILPVVSNIIKVAGHVPTYTSDECKRIVDALRSELVQE